MNAVTRKLVNAGYGLALLILAANALLAYFDNRAIGRGNWWVDHTREVIDQLERTASTLKDAETGQRGYLLTGRDEYLRPYIDSSNRLEGEFDRVAALTADNPGQQARVAELRRIAGVKLEELGRTLSLMRAGDREAAMAVVRTDRGQAAMDRARSLLAEMRAEEDRLLARRSGAYSNSAWRAAASVAMATILVAASLLLVSHLRRREDIERDRAFENLRQGEEWLSRMMESIGDGVVATDGRGRVRLMNPVARRLTGWTQAEAAGRPLEEVFRIVNEETRQTAESPVLRAIREGIVMGLANHTVLIARDGSETAIEDSAAPIKDAAGEVVGVVMVFQDATERRRREAELRAAKEESEHANRVKDQFLAVLSHELRTPLNPILLAVTGMLERRFPVEEVGPTLAMIRQNVNLQARLIDDLLDVMRIVRGKMPLEWGVSDCHDLIHQAVEICRSDFLSKGQRLVLDLAAGSHCVEADSARLQQVFWNLLKNAVKFTPTGGTITVRTRDEGDLGRHLVVEVSDTGIGIEPEILPTIWDPFQQGETTITRKFGGLGLGLAICKGILDAHGGTLAVESPGKGLGTTFRVTLAAVPTPDASPDCGEAGGDAPRFSPVRLAILLVEDEPSTLRLLSRLLAGLGHRVTSASTIADAWEAFQGGEIELIVSDVGLPDGSGHDLMRRVRAVRPVPAIALTGYGMDEDVRRSREAGFASHMTKPIDFTKLEALIRQVAGS